MHYLHIPNTIFHFFQIIPGSDINCLVNRRKCSVRFWIRRYGANFILTLSL